MNNKRLPVTIFEHALSVRSDMPADTVIPSLDKGSMIQTHYLVRSQEMPVMSFSIDTASMLESWKPIYEKEREELSLPTDRFPYGMTEASWWQYCLAPHSYLSLGSDQCQIGLNFFNRFLHLDLNQKSAFAVDPKIGDELLSTTNWYDQDKHELWFASWPGRDTAHRLIDPVARITVKIWKISLNDGKCKQVWLGHLGDSLHQLAVNPDRRYLVLTELGLRTTEALPMQPCEEAPETWAKLRAGGLVPSAVLVLDLQTFQEWRFPMIAAGHVEFDPVYPDICYISGHNIGLIGVKVGIFGPGCIKKYRLTENGPICMGEFSDSRFYRITTHSVFRHQDKTLIGVSGYPGSLFLIDASTMKLCKVLDKDTGGTVDATRYPHLCRQDSYGIAPTQDGEAILLSGTGFVQFAEIEAGRFTSAIDIDHYGANACFTGHLGTLNSSRRSNH